MRTLALVAVALVLAGTGVWTDAWALEDRFPAHDQRSAAVDTAPAAVVAIVADARPSSSSLPLLPIGAAAVLGLAALRRRVPTSARATYPASRRLVHAGRRAPPLGHAHVGPTT
jgi:hypothetical protein